MIKATNNIQYTVRGRWPFPEDMLRRDLSGPVFVSDRNLINRMTGPHTDEAWGMNKVTIRLKVENNGRWNSYHERDRFMPNIARWKSFGWEVISIDGKDYVEPEPVRSTFQPKPIERYRIASGTDIVDSDGITAHMIVDPEGPYVLYEKVKDLIK